MNRAQSRNLLFAIATGMTCLLGSAAISYWHFSQQQWCVRFTASGGQEATYSRGCRNPHRYRRWIFTASRFPLPGEHRLQAVAGIDEES